MKKSRFVLLVAILTAMTSLQAMTMKSNYSPIVNEREETEATANSSEITVKSFDWHPVMNAIIQVESGGNSKAKNGIYCGAMQISPVLVRECNNILQARKINKRFALSDRFSIAKSKEMFVLIQSKYNPQNSIEKAIRMWNGGANYRVSKTNRYYNKVMNKMKNL